MTGQGLLDRMELLNAELQLQSGEADVARGLLALNVAQDYFESLAAQRKNIMGSAAGTVTATVNTETTAFPTGVLRIDKLFTLNAASRPSGELRRVHRTGGHAGAGNWPLSLFTGTGSVSGYWTNGTLIYWSPLPSATTSVRWYGFSAASDITASGTFAYPDVVAMPLAAYAAQLLKSGLDDDVAVLSGLANSTFTAALDAMERFNRDGAQPLTYTEHHTT